MIAIIDYGAGNLQSVYKALKHIQCDAFITKDTEKIRIADGAVLPGVGSFGDTIDSMVKLNIKNTVLDFIRSKKPFLGICLGLQLLFPGSEESPGAHGLSVFNGQIKKIPQKEGFKIPHMGWNSLNISKKEGLFKNIQNNPYVYFVHSYYLDAADKKMVSSTTNYSVPIDASIHFENIIATQFHPEKSGDIGIKMLQNFADLVT